MNMKFMKTLRPLIGALLAANLGAGCAVGPNYHKPDVYAPSTFRNQPENPQAAAQAASYADLPWWEVFPDPVLQDLIRTALKRNYDLLIATERINAARGQLAVTRSSLFPQVKGEGECGAAHGGRRVSSGFIRRAAARHASFARAVAGDGSSSANGSADAGERRCQ